MGSLGVGKEGNLDASTRVTETRKMEFSAAG